MGTLIRNTDRQPRPPVSSPPSSTPAVAPPAATAPQTPRALVRSAPSANVAVTSDNAAGEEGTAAAEQVRQPATEGQQAAEGDDVGRNHPGQGGQGSVQPGGDVRDGDVHDRRIEHDHELCGGQQGQGQPPTVYAGALVCAHSG